MANNIKISPEEMKNKSRIFNSSANNTQQMISKLNNQINQLRSSWAGAAQNSFIQEYQQLQPSMKKFVQVLNGISKQLSDVATTMQQTDQQIASKLRR